MIEQDDRLIVLQGLPASGKTTRALELVGMGYKRVSKDDLRAMLDSGKFSIDNENFILNIQDIIIDYALLHGQKVVVDNTNLAQKHLNRIGTIADLHMVTPLVELMDTPLDECIERDKNRKNSVGEDVITRMYNRYLKK